MPSQDPDYSSVSLLVPMEGPNNGTSFKDFSPSPKPISAFGNTKISTAQSKWGKGSGVFDGTGDYLTTSDQSGLTFGTDSITIEFHIFPTTVSGYHALVDFRPAGSSGNYLVIDMLNAAIRVLVGSTVKITQSGTLSANTWAHVRLAKNGSSATLFVNANSFGSASISESLLVGASRPIIGVSGFDYLYGYAGYMQDLRIYKGVAHGFGYPVPGRLVIPHFPDYGPVVAVGNNVTVSGNGAGDYVAVIDATTKELVKLAEPDTNGDWSADVPAGEYYALYFGDGCQPICHGPYTLTVT